MSRMPHNFDPLLNNPNTAGFTIIHCDRREMPYSGDGKMSYSGFTYTQTQAFLFGSSTLRGDNVKIWMTCAACLCVTHCRHYHSRPRRNESTQTRPVAEFSMERYLGSDELTDVEFVVEPQLFPGTTGTFKAHRVILALQNEVFKAMFFGHFGENERVVITDLHPDGFEGLLKFFYSGKLEPQSVYQALCIRSAAIKYLVTELAAMCLDHVKNNMGPEDVCPALDYTVTTGEDGGVTEHATEFIRKSSSSVLFSDTFKTSSQSVVGYVLDNVRYVSENSVLEALHAWGMHQCCHREPSGGQALTVRSVVSCFLPKIRFLTLTPMEFIHGPSLHGLLSDSEALALLCNIIQDGSIPMPDGFSRIRSFRM